MVKRASATLRAVAMIGPIVNSFIGFWFARTRSDCGRADDALSWRCLARLPIIDGAVNPKRP
jgi:hypothetical protein